MKSTYLADVIAVAFGDRGHVESVKLGQWRIRSRIVAIPPESKTDIRRNLRSFGVRAAESCQVTMNYSHMDWNNGHAAAMDELIIG